MTGEKKAYNFQEVEARWQRRWEEDKLYLAEDFSSKPKQYVLVEFPFLSGDGLHVGHSLSYIAQDAVARYLRMRGNNVLYPMGWDAFGLPTENFAIKTKTKPQEVTSKNIANFKRQIQSLGISFDWSRELSTADPAYYKWTQWIFLQLLRRGLAEKKEMPINWCPSCKIGLAFEEVVDGKCERCGTDVERRNIKQWVLKITKYADRLISDLETVNFLPEVKQSQINWIGRSEGAEIDFVVAGSEAKITVFTSRADTIFSAAFIILAPEHPILRSLASKIENPDEVQQYIQSSQGKTDRERQESREKTSVQLKGIRAVNPANGKDIPVWLSDFVLASYGTGAVFADAHDERDFEMAKKYGIPITVSLRPSDEKLWGKVEALEVCYSGDGTLVNSEQFNGMASAEARPKIIKWLADERLGRVKVNFKLRDWIFSRQHYWGEPIPVVYCTSCAGIRQKVLIIHGFESSAKSKWFPWMKRELEARGFDVFVPTLTTSMHPDLASWLAELDTHLAKMGPDDIVIGHSLGSKAALHLLERGSKKIKRLYLIASAIGSVHERDWGDLHEMWPDFDIPALRKFWEAPVDFTAVDANVGHTVVILSDDDPYIKKKSHDALPSSWRFELWQGHGHFDVAEAPELLEAVLEAKVTGWVPVDVADLPVTLPDVEYYEPTDTGESPLAKVTEWVQVTCPVCGRPAQRETDTMPNWAGSSWYFLRYSDPNNDTVLADMEKLKYWLSVDLYNGGAEHTTLHLLYSRFWHKFLYDIGAVPGLEPYQRRVQHGIILAPDGVKMSKSQGNVINPDDIVAQYGADVFRLYMLFMGEYDQIKLWNDQHIRGVARFMNSIRKYFDAVVFDDAKGVAEEITAELSRTIKGIEGDMGRRSFNTIVSKLMICWEKISAQATVHSRHAELFAKLIAPFVPHFAEELWRGKLGKRKSVHLEAWPIYDTRLIEPADIVLGVQVNGKVRAELTVDDSMREMEIREAVMKLEGVRKFTDGRTVKKFIYIPRRIISIVV